MLRALVLFLLLANGGYWAWSHGWLRELGFAPQQQAEPQRLKEQIHPEGLRVLTPESADKAAKAAKPREAPPRAPEPAPAADVVAAAPVAGGECLQAGVFDAAQAEVLRRAAATLPEGRWRLEPATLPGRWMVYMGRFADAEALAKKRTELRALDVPFDRPSAALEPGLSLGRYSTEEAAQRGLAGVSAQGVRSARVVQERLDTPGFVLRLPDADARLRAQAEGLRTALAGKSLRPCS